jgi:serine/threonine protein kinase
MSESPEPPEQPSEGTGDGLLTADDLFGDLVDAPLVPSTGPATRRSAPVRVQIPEREGPDAAMEPPAPKTATVLPEEVAGLLDAFGPGPDAPVSVPLTTSPQTPAPQVEPPSPPSPPSPIAAGGAEVDALLNNLSAMEEPVQEIEAIFPPPPQPETPAVETSEPLIEAEPPVEAPELSVEAPEQLVEAPERVEAPEPLTELEPLGEVPEPPSEIHVEHAADDEGDFGVLVDKLTESQDEQPSEATEVPAPASPEAPRDVPAKTPKRALGEEENIDLLLDNLSAHEPEPTLEAAAIEIATPEGEPIESPASPPVEEPTVASLTAEDPVGEPPVEDSALVITPVLPGQPEASGDLDHLLSNFLETAPPPEARPGPPPAPAFTLKFQALEPRVEAAKETRSVIDLAALADEALSLPLTRPGVPLPMSPAQPPDTRETAAPGAYGPYRLLERVAAGGMAEVFRAKRSGVEGFEKVVAVKRILPHLSDNKEFVEMFIDEAKMVAGLSHPNIVQIFDLGRIEKTYFIAMEYVHGRDLRTILKRAKEKGLRIPLDLSVLVISKVCSALEYAHRKKDEGGLPLKIVHRDISPQNILISFEGEVKLTDFGIAKATSKATDTDRGALRGKLLYMSPEQASGQPLDKRSDVFSLGVVFYEVITDAKPFLGTSEKGILEMVRQCRVEPPRSLNPRVGEKLERVMMKALEKDPEARYQDASEMYRDLERVLHERQPPASTELARFMEVLFEENVETASNTPASPEAVEEEGIEIDLDSGAAAPQSPPPPPVAAEEPEKDPHGLGRLLKRFGIK